MNQTASGPSPTPAPNAPPPLADLARWVAVASLLALIALCLAWELVLAPLKPGGSWIAFKALPLCLPLAGLLKHRMYTYRALSLWIWLYFTEGVVRAYSDTAPSNYYALAEVALTVVLFVACVVHIRVRLAAAKARGLTETAAA
ncbi:DUF2069 domain-containing protein [Curvibacter sp. APW13]|uniref:DUF2069 domain-containing protein n=1 Tax=Curvibacter sp. APW13 TaxID=3077236 RepID=UPI0028DEACC0|nr:DUF2069 domain-containing protein [Curvibacter sp. APW13]MDT8989253.1 DUF2069 domain-containing protein [Curvibacter sp. APW13]